MKITQYELSENMEFREVDSNKFSDLIPGQVLRWGGNRGYAARNWCILHRAPSGCNNSIIYLCFDLDHPGQNANLNSIRSTDIKDPNDPEVWHQQHYFTTRMMVESEDITRCIGMHEEQREAQKEAHAAALKENQRLAEIGREIYEKHFKGAKALIVAELHQNDSDIYTDYFSFITKEAVILRPSKHKRDLFPELRKAAAMIPETAHYAEKPEKPADADEWWRPADEHRDKHSMGAGYWLGDDLYTGWIIRKEKYLRLEGAGLNWVYVMLAKRHDHLEG